MKFKLSLLLAASGFALICSPAMAQSAAAAPASNAPANNAPANTNQLAEVVVTAQRQQTNAQTTPIAMTVYSAAEIQEKGIHNIASLSQVDPSVSFTPSNGAGYVAVRGIASTDLTEIGDPAVPVARDGFFTNRSYSLQASLFDVSRIEVLKGPQGTLFGRNSVGGLISVITQRPTRTFGGYASADYGVYDAQNFEGALNVPLGDQVQLRVSGLSRYHKGYRDNGPGINRGDDENNRSLRAQLQFEPIDGFNGLISVQRDNTNGTGDIARSLPLGALPITSGSTNFTAYTQAKNNIDSSRYHWEFSYAKLPFNMTATYLGGYDEVQFHHALDATPYSTPNLTTQFLQNEHPITQNHELRLASPSDGRLTWQVGYFHFSEINNPLDSGLYHVGGPFAGQYTIQFHYVVDSYSDAGFGQIGYKFTDNLKLTVGARYTRDEKIRTGDALLNLFVASGGHAGFPGLVITTPGNGHVVETKPTYHVGLDWQVAPQNLLYAKFDTGFKSGGFNSNGSAPSVNYGPETVNAWEVGSKNRFLNNALQFNVDGFYMDYDGYQASQFTPALGGGPGIQNAGNARIYGAEAEVIALTPVGRFDANATWQNARFVKFNAVNPAGTATVNLAGNALPVAPDFAASMGFEHTFDVGNYGNIVGRIEGTYKSKYYFSFFNYPDTAQPAYATGNLSAIYTPNNDNHWDVQLYIRNFTNTVSYAFIQRNANANDQNIEYAPPMTYGIKLNVRW